MTDPTNKLHIVIDEADQMPDQVRTSPPAATDFIEFPESGGFGDIPVLNRARLHALAEFVETHDWFDMGTVQHPCGTPACIAGCACHIASDADYSSMALAAECLGLTAEQKTELFMPHFDPDGLFYAAEPGELGYVTREHAAAVLRHLAETGTVDWSVPAADTNGRPQ